MTGLEPLSASQSFRRLITPKPIAAGPLAGDVTLPAPIDQRGYRAPCEIHSSKYWPPTPANQGSVPAAPDTPMTNAFARWITTKEPARALWKHGKNGAN